PMNAVMGILNVINAEKNGEMEDELKIVNSSFNQLLYLIEEILLLSKLHTEQVDIKYREVSLKLLFQDIVSELKNKISESNKKIDIEFEFNGDIIVKQDPYLILKMLQHITDNAVKYTDSGKISLGYGIENSNCYGYVKDTGIGIDEIKMDTIFQEFKKAEVEDRFYQGVGIGLAIVKKISDLVEAPVTLESEKNKGTIFRVEFKQYNVS
ncbi:MAG: HAMP domain-containing histidine kinase, partial [Bacteroidales bacterium]